MHRKRSGQIAVFAILAAILLVGLAITLTILRKPVEVKPEAIAASAVKSLVTSCITEAAQNGAHLIGKQGGYVTLGSDRFEMDGVSLGPFSHRGRLVSPSVDDLEKDLARFIDTKLPFCVAQNKASLGFNLSYRQPKTTVDINPSKVAIKTDFIVEANPGPNVERVSEFSYVLPVRLGLLHELGASIIADRESHLGFHDVSFLSELPVPVEMRVFNESYLVFTLIDNESITRIEFPYLFNVVMDSPPNEPPNILFIPEKFSLKVGQRFLYNVAVADPENDPVTLSSYNPLFSITANGVIDFTPSEEGTFEVDVEAFDDKEAGSAKTLIFEVSK